MPHKRKTARKSRHTDDKIYVEHVRINSQGYDRSGRYWGVGEKLYRVYNDIGFDRYIRAPNAKNARLVAVGVAPFAVQKVTTNS